ncbi:MAG: porin family protein [Methylobacter sp.]|nr:porin family protein [Methylobacter sp.]
MINKTKLALGIAAATLTMTGALVSPQVMAHSKADRIAEAASNKADALEAQLQAMQAELSRLRAEVNRPASSAEAEKVQELDQWMTSVKSTPAESKKSKDNMVFFRGGYGHANAGRGGTLDPTFVPALGGASNRSGVLSGNGIADQDAWYFGAGFDFSLNDNLFGLMDKTEVLAELMFDYKQLGERQINGLNLGTTVPVTVAALGGATAPVSPNTESATVNQLTLAASPKVKFMKGSAFRPWLIPVGFELNVISPPSDAITVLNPGMQFGAGADYKIWKDLYVGADARYHYSADNIDGVRTDGVTAGGYLGIGF